MLMGTISTIREESQALAHFNVSVWSVQSSLALLPLNRSLGSEKSFWRADLWNKRLQQLEWTQNTYEGCKQNTSE